MTKTITAFDTETTGLNTQSDHIVELGLVKFDSESFKILGEKKWYIKPGCDFEMTAGAQEITGLTKEFILENGVLLTSIWDEALEFIGDDDILSYNGNHFDVPMLYNNLTRNGLSFDFEHRTFYDSLVIERKRNSLKLGDVYKRYTGEDMLEINCHGGPRTVQRILQLLSACGFRPAEGGEFTRRAFLNGKMDLSQAEAVMDIITADAEKSRKIALEQLHGSVSRAVHSAEQSLLDALAAMDAAIDYPEEVEEDCMEGLPDQLADAEHAIRELIANGRAGRVLRDGARVVILGKPNVGKSSILNAFAGRDRAIVTAIAGTTRDILDEKIVFDGVPVRLIDTAGVHGTDNEVEQIGIDRAMDEALQRGLDPEILQAPEVTEEELEELVLNMDDDSDDV